MSHPSLTPAGWQQMIQSQQAQQQTQSQQTAQMAQSQQNQAMSQSVYNGTLGTASGTSYYGGGGLLTGSSQWMGINAGYYPKYTNDELKQALNEEVTFTSSGAIPVAGLQGKLIKIDGLYCEVKEGRNLFLVSVYEIQNIPVIDKMKESLLYKLAVPPVTFTANNFWGIAPAQQLGYATQGQLTYNNVVNAMNIAVNKSRQP